MTMDTDSIKADVITSDSIINSAVRIEDESIEPLIEDWARRLALRHNGHENYYKRFIDRARAELLIMTEELGWKITRDG